MKIYVNHDEWTYLNQNFDKQHIKNVITERIKDEPLPFEILILEDALNDFENLKKTNLTIKESSSIFSRYEYKYPFSELYLPSSPVGNKSSAFFHNDSRYLCDSINSPSPVRSWTTPKFRDSLLNALWSLKVDKVSTKELTSCINLRKYVASQFRPLVAKRIYSYFNAKHVLDFSAGWGDRLAGFCADANTKSYFGIDPNERLFDGYDRQIATYGNNKQITMVNKAAEDVIFPEKEFDMIFTSPPYFNVERYTQEPNQSWKRYKNINQWLEKFLFEVLRKCIDVLKKDGILAINISDVYSGHKINKICDPMNDYLIGQGLKYGGTIGYEMRKRINSKSDKQGVFVEPIWIWEKINGKI